MPADPQGPADPAGLTVLLAPPGPACGVLDVLADLSGVGLVEPFVWVPADGEGVWTVRGGRRVAAALHEAVRYSPPQVRLCVLVPVGGGAPVTPEVESQVAERLRRATGQSVVTRVRVVLAGAGDSAGADVVARDGWHNVLVAPEDAVAPGAGHRLLPGDDPAAIARHSAPTVAALLGMWVGAPRCVLDDMLLPPSAAVRLVRGFFRRVDAADLEGELRHRVLATGPELPRAIHHGVPAVPIKDVPAACARAVDEVAAAHGEVFAMPRDPVPTPVDNPRGLWEVLRWFGRFLVEALRRAPRDVGMMIGNTVSRHAARTVQNLVLGQGSVYTVVLNGMSGQGPLGATALAQAAGRLGAGLPPGAAAGQDGEVDLNRLWGNMAAGAFTLADSGDGRLVRPEFVGADRAVLRDPAGAAPGPAADFTVPARLVPRVHVESVVAADVFGAYLLRAGLQHVAQDHRDPNLAREAENARSDLDRWIGRHRDSYTVRFGTLLGGKLWQAAHDVQTIAQQLAALADEAGQELRTRNLFRRLKITFYVTVVVLIAFAAMVWLEVLDWGRAGLYIGITGVVWLVVSLVWYLLEERWLMGEINRQQLLVRSVDVLLRNLRQAVRDVYRLALAYDGFLPWARALGAVLAAPYGAAPPAGATKPRIARGLPGSVRVAEVMVDEPRIAEAARVLRLAQFPSGWLTGPWDAAIAAVRGPDGDLPPGWAEQVAERCSRPDDGAWARVRTRIDATGTLAADLLATVRGTDDQARLEDIGAFLGGVNGRPGGWFDGALVVPAIHTVDPGGVAEERSQTCRVGAGLGTQAVLVQLSDPVPGYALVAGSAGRTAPDDSGPVDPDVPPVPPHGVF